MSLTAGADTIVGTADNDTVQTADKGVIGFSFSGPWPTWTSADSVDGGAGVNTLKASIGGTVTPAIGAVKNIQNLELTSIGDATVTFANAAGTSVNIAGVTSITNTASTGTLTLTNLVAVPEFTIFNTAAATNATFATGVLSGSADSVTLNLNGVTGNVVLATTGAGIETLNIVTSGVASNLGAGGGLGGAATTVNISGAGQLNLGTGASFGATTNFDASSSSGGVTAVFANRAAAGETAVALKGGSGNDSFDISAFAAANFGHLTIDMGAGNDTLNLGAHDGTITTGSTINGGAGTDTLIVTTALTAAEGARISNFEVLNFGDTGLTQDADHFSGTTFGTSTAIADLTVSDLANNSVLNVNHSMTDFLAGNLKTDTANDSVTVNIGGTAGAVTLAALRLSSTYENVTLNSQGTAANVLTAINTNAFNNLTVTGATALTITGTGTLTGVLDAAAHTGAFTATTSTTALTVNGGAGVDTLVSGLLGTGVTQTLNGGDGNDVLTAGAIITNGNLILNGGAGSDTINTVAMVGAGDAVATASIDGGTGIDFITLDPNTNAGQVVQTVVSTVTAVADADKITGFTTAVDKFDYNGTVLNDAATTITGVANATLAGALAADADATVFIQTDNLIGAAATNLTALATATTVEGIIAAYATFEASLVAQLGVIAGLDATLATNEAVLLAFDNGTHSVILRATNTDHSTANTFTVAELELVSVLNGTAVLAAADFI